MAKDGRGRRAAASRTAGDVSHLRPGEVSHLRPGDDIAGYRVRRVLAVTEHGVVCVARDDQAPAEPELLLRVASDELGRAAIEREVAILDRVRHEHLVRLVDVAGTPGGFPMAAFEYLDRGALGTLLEARRALDAGEAVTVLVSVLRGIDALHRSGIAHGSIDEGRVLLDGAGRPVLIGLGSALELGEDGVGDREFADDFRCFAELAERVLARTEREGREDECATALAWLQGSSPLEVGEDYFPAAERLLLSIAQPAPIRRERERGTVSEASPVRVPGKAEARMPRSPARWSGAQRGRSASTGSTGAQRRRSASTRWSGGVRALLEGSLAGSDLWERVLDGDVIGELRRRVSAFAGARRRQLLFSAVAASVLLVVMLTVLPGTAPGSDDTAVVGARRGATAVTNSTPRPGSAGHTGVAADARPTPAGRATGPATEVPHERTGEDPDPATTEDDPVRVASALMKARRSCLDGGSLDCLSATDQAGSPLWTADRERLGSGGTTSHEPASGSAPASSAGDAGRCASGADCAASLVDRIGGTAVVALTPKGSAGGGDAGYAMPATILLIETEAGWRLREIFEN